MLQHDPGAFDNRGNRWHAWWFVAHLAHLGLYEEAKDWKDRLENMPLSEERRELVLQDYMDAIGQYEEVVTDTQARLADMSDEEVLDAFHERGLLWTLDLADAGDMERAIELLESIQHAPATWAEREAWAPLALAGLYREVGRDDEAALVLDGIVAQLEADFDHGIRHPETLSFLAEAYAMQKRDDEAIKMFGKAVDYHLRDDCGWLDMPAWERLKDDPRVISLCERMATDREQQAERIRNMLAEHDVDTLLAPLMAMAADSSDQ
jgi:tetratricopeptide (TPR) repeat protein